MMKRLFSWLALVFAVAIASGCAHPITMNPDLSTIAGDPSAVIGKSVGYHIAESAKALEVTTGGGGGDKVRYFPYRDLEPGLYKALSELFTAVSRVQDPKDTAAMNSKGIQLLIVPEIKTLSSSESVFTWPPTQFTVDLTCTVSSPQGQAVDVIRVSGYGQATFDEFKSNFSLAAVRASNDALGKLVKALTASSRLRN
ncbi:hypothetical protein O4H66_14360 [Comamonadaceae bacterium G21597-S1]|nr:hypothetical protein [Comamonadaceae bacterium G21597-S1]